MVHSTVPLPGAATVEPKSSRGVGLEAAGRTRRRKVLAARSTRPVGEGRNAGAGSDGTRSGGTCSVVSNTMSSTGLGPEAERGGERPPRAQTAARGGSTAEERGGTGSSGTACSA